LQSLSLALQALPKLEHLTIHSQRDIYSYDDYTNGNGNGNTHTYTHTHTNNHNTTNFARLLLEGGTDNGGLDTKGKAYLTHLPPGVSLHTITLSFLGIFPSLSRADVPTAADGGRGDDRFCPSFAPTGAGIEEEGRTG
jgi:hypothetical protein